jgi:hypothetical protein
MKKSGCERLSLSFLERLFGINMRNDDECRPTRRSASRKPSADVVNSDEVSLEVADGLRLVQAYLRISEVDLRRSLVSHFERIANGGAPAELTIRNMTGNRERTRKTRRLS